MIHYALLSIDLADDVCPLDPDLDRVVDLPEHPVYLEPFPSLSDTRMVERLRESFPAHEVVAKSLHPIAKRRLEDIRKIQALSDPQTLEVYVQTNGDPTSPLVMKESRGNAVHIEKNFANLFERVVGSVDGIPDMEYGLVEWAPGELTTVAGWIRWKDALARPGSEQDLKYLVGMGSHIDLCAKATFEGAAENGFTVLTCPSLVDSTYDHVQDVLGHIPRLEIFPTVEDLMTRMQYG